MGARAAALGALLLLVDLAAASRVLLQETDTENRNNKVGNVGPPRVDEDQVTIEGDALFSRPPGNVSPTWARTAPRSRAP